LLWVPQIEPPLGATKRYRGRGVLNEEAGAVSDAEPDEARLAAFVKVVGERVRAVRQASGISQSRLERDAEVRPTTVSQLERGEGDPTVYDLYRLASALNVELRALLPDETSFTEAGQV
jgi:ribosome-binding protein aMBF1 (putative translation factor)